MLPQRQWLPISFSLLPGSLGLLAISWYVAHLPGIDGVWPTSIRRAFLRPPLRSAPGGSPSLGRATLPSSHPQARPSGPPADPHVPYQ